jgi:hypothetical protein
MDKEQLLAKYPTLELAESSKKTPWALCAANIRLELRRVFPGVPFSVRSDSFAGGDSVNVSWTDGPTTKRVSSIVDKYKEGYFDGMDDIYVSTQDAFNRLFGGTKYLSVDREYSDGTLALVLTQIHAEHDNPENLVPEAKEYRAGRLMFVTPARHCNSYQELVSDRLKVLDLTPKAPAPGSATVGRLTGCTVRHNPELNGVEIIFPTRPDAGTLSSLKDSHFRWSQRTKLWYAKFTPRTWELAHKIAGLPCPTLQAQAS